MRTSAPSWAVSNFKMPAMSPTMTEGGIAQWKKKEGETFSAGDVLLEIETDKATIDVEAQEDGIMGKILMPDGMRNIQVGKVIALLAEEGDDISNLEAPEETEPTPPKSEAVASSSGGGSQSSSDSAPQKAPSEPTTEPRRHVTPSHSRTLFPSVLRLLTENGIEQASKIKGTGVRGMITKGDVLAHLGKASGPLGTYKAFLDNEAKKSEKVEQKKDASPAPLDGPSMRKLIVMTMLENSIKARSPPPSKSPVDFDSIIADYLPPSPRTSSVQTVSSTPKAKSSDFLDGLI